MRPSGSDARPRGAVATFERAEQDAGVGGGLFGVGGEFVEGVEVGGGDVEEPGVGEVAVAGDEFVLAFVRLPLACAGRRRGCGTRAWPWSPRRFSRAMAASSIALAAAEGATGSNTTPTVRVHGPPGGRRFHPHGWHFRSWPALDPPRSMDRPVDPHAPLP